MRTQWHAYAAAVAATAVALVVRMALTPFIGPFALPFVVFFPAVAFAAWYGGLRTGALCLILSALAAAYFFYPSFLLPHPADRIGLLIYVFAGLCICLLGESQRRAAETARRELLRGKEAEKAERAERHRFETTLASIGDAVISTDPQGRIHFANSVARSLLRFPGNLAGLPLDDVFRIIDERSIAHPKVLLAHNGTEIPIDHSASLIRGENGEIHGTVIVFRDITARRQATEELRRKEAELEIILNRTPFLLTRCSRDHRYQFVSRAYAEMLGRQPEEIAGKAVVEIMGNDGYNTILPYVETVLRGEQVEYETGVHFRDVGMRSLQVVYTPDRDRAGNVIGWVASILDITQRKQAEEALRVSNEALMRSNADLERFAFMASHDLQEPLRMIAVYAQLLVKEYRTEADRKVAAYASHIVDGTVRMRALIADLLTYSELRHEGPGSAETVDLNCIIAEVKANLKASIDETAAVITSDSLPAIRAHAAHFTSLFQNLLGNAIKYRSECPPRIHISCRCNGQELLFSVTDNGIGIDSEYHDKIFAAFQRLHGRKVPGTGIGLAICQRVVGRYGGRIWVESEVAKGSAFHFTLPATKQ